MNTTPQITFSPENESKAIDWLLNRGGIAVWRNVNMSSQALGSETFTPAKMADGTPADAPSWQVSIAYIVTDPAMVRIEGKREVARCKVVRGKYGPPADPIARGRVGLDKAIAKAGPAAWWEFDYSNSDGFSPWCEAVVFVPSDSRAIVMPVSATS